MPYSRNGEDAGLRSWVLARKALERERERRYVGGHETHERLVKAR